MLIANPPYGERLSELDDGIVYLQLGTASAPAGLTSTADRQTSRQATPAPSCKTPLFNGAIECRLFEFKMVAGSNRR